MTGCVLEKGTIYCPGQKVVYKKTFLEKDKHSVLSSSWVSIQKLYMKREVSL